MDNLQIITGIYFRSPGEKSLEKELTVFQNTTTSLDFRTYEFTHKDFKSTLKKVAENDVNIRIIIEDKKYKQYANTLKELVRYFS